MKFYFWNLLAIVAVTVIAVLIGIVSIKYFGNDDEIKEKCESVIKNETAINASLLPTETKKDIN